MANGITTPKSEGEVLSFVALVQQVARDVVGLKQKRLGVPLQPHGFC